VRTEKVVVVSKPLLLYSLHHPTLTLKAPLAVSLEYEAAVYNDDLSELMANHHR
jgi:hypothetical protein